MGAKTNSELVKYARAYLEKKAAYWYGCIGGIGSKALYESKQKQYPNNYPTAQYENTDYYDADGKIVMDCCGLIKACLNAETPGAPAPYVKENDLSAKGYYDQGCDIKGKLDGTFVPHVGQLIFKVNNNNVICHVGIYAGNGKVIEAKGHQYGVIESDFNSSWKYWGQCKFVTDDTSQLLSNYEVANEVINGKWGNGQDRYDRLRNAGYDPKAIQDLVNYLVDPLHFACPSTGKVSLQVINTAVAEQYLNDIKTMCDKLLKMIKEEK